MGTIYERLSAVILEGDREKAPGLVQAALDDGLPPQDILDNGLVNGMSEVGARFKRGDIFVPEVLLSAEAMQAGLEVLRPHLNASGSKPRGRVLLGTVKGDLHDIGKNLVGMMCEGAGFEVLDLGFNVPPEAFVAAIEEKRPEIVGMSALLTTTMGAMGEIIQSIKAAGLRDQVKIMVGGAPIDEAFADRIGADGYGSNAVTASELARRFVESDSPV